MSEVAVGAFGLIQSLEGAGVNQQLAEAVVFLLGAIALMDGVGFAQGHHVGHPGYQAGILYIAGCVEVQALHDGRVHQKSS